ncbi:LRR domain containing protein [Trema orientale]|uniref:LRR domain containing protein n=1 Tax=Trema orientale TaxID=63057 RepID=A0A2P5B0S5_TREOI|nr:LRR domain containing protein [Trema orientale]
MDAQVLRMTLVICFCFKAQVVTPQNLTCDPNDLRALQDFMADSETVGNRFSRPVPDNLPSYQNLNNVNLARNNFTGRSQIPKSSKNFLSLYYLYLSNNSNSNISSAHRTLQQCENHTALALSLNFRNKELPAHLAFPFGKLRILITTNCGLRDSLLHWLSSSSKLELLDISWNHLDGTIPIWFWKF